MYHAGDSVPSRTVESQPFADTTFLAASIHATSSLTAVAVRQTTCVVRMIGEEVPSSQPSV